GKSSTANFTVAASTESGASTLVVIVNGIPSQPTSVTIGSGGTYTLSVSVVRKPGGLVTSSPSGINCGSTCSHSYNAGTQVTLTASPDLAWGFFGWFGGGCSGIPSSCTVTLNGNTIVSATFGTLFSAEPVFQPDATLRPPVLSSYP